MKPTVRVSIGGLAFTLEEDAYKVLENYLQTLRNHFANSPESEEIISDIEFRMSELLQMRLNTNEGVVSINDAHEIIQTMGNPKDFDYATENNNTNESTINNISHQKSNADFEKKLFRDTENKIIGGVCSGIGHYFRIDPTAIRLIFVAIFLLLFFAASHGPSCLVIIGLYIILWIVMPSAKTFGQKLAMSGSDPSIANIEERPQAAPRKYRGSSINTVLGVLLNIVVGILAIIAIITLVALVGSFIWLHLDTDIIGLSNYLMLMGFDTWTFKASILIITAFPIIGFIVLMIKVLRRSSFSSGSIISFIVCIVIWVAAMIYVGNKGFRFAYFHDFKSSATEAIPSGNTSDKLYVNLGNEYNDNRFLPQNKDFMYRGDANKREICILPNIRVEEDSALTNYKMEIHKHAYGESPTSARINAEALQFDYALSDSVLTLNPQWYNRHNTWNMEFFDIIITKPKGKEIILGKDLNRSHDILYHNATGNYRFRFDPF